MQGFALMMKAMGLDAETLAKSTEVMFDNMANNIMTKLETRFDALEKRLAAIEVSVGLRMSTIEDTLTIAGHHVQQETETPPAPPPV